MTNADCPTCKGTGEVEMGYLPKLGMILWTEACPACFPDTVRRHPLHRTIRFGDGMPDPDPGEKKDKAA